MAPLVSLEQHYLPIQDRSTRSPRRRTMVRMTSRVRRVLKLVDELELDSEERRALKTELAAREECVVDLDGATDDERETLSTLKRRIDAHLRGDTKPVTMTDLRRRAREQLRAGGVRTRAVG